MIEKLSDINPDMIVDEQSKSIVVLLLNIVENQQRQINEQAAEIQSLKDEISKLKGEQGVPTFKPSKKKNISSDAHRHRPKKHQKKGKKSNLEIDKEITCNIDKKELPSDAIFKGYETKVQQNIIFKRENTKFYIAVWYSPSQGKTFRAEAVDYEGYFGNGLKNFAIVMHNAIDVTHSKLHSIFKFLQIEISTGSLQNILSKDADIFIQEKDDILKAGLSGSYTQSDTTGANVCGELYRTHIICSEFFAVFSTLKGKGRKHLLYALQGEPQDGLMMAYNQTTKQYLEHFKISKIHTSQIENIFSKAPVLSEAELHKIIKEKMPDLASKKTTFNWVCDAFAFGHYHHQDQYPKVDILVSDDAAEYKLIGKHQSLCWVHDGRYYNKLIPLIDCHKKNLSDFKEKYWLFYNSLLEYKVFPTKEKKQSIEQDFDNLFVSNTPYFDLNKVIDRTRGDKEQLLLVLEHPEIPLHNNGAELAARKQVQKRDICLHTITRLGTQIQDAFMSIIYTCNLLGVNAYSYIMNRIEKKNELYLPDLVYSQINSS